MRSAGDTLPPVRVSDAERDRALRALRDAAAEGRRSGDSFERRVDQALRSRSRAELDDLTSDLPSKSRLADAAVHMASSLSWFRSRMRVAWRAPQHDRLRLPVDTGRCFVLGRAPGCDLLIRHPTASRTHARLQYTEQGWLLTDLHSTNGTRINCWIVTQPELIRAGDEVAFGSQRYLVTH